MFFAELVCPIIKSKLCSLHNCWLQLFGQDYNLVSHTMIGGACSLKSILKDRFLGNFSWQFYFALRVFADQIFVYIFVLMFDLGFELWPDV